MLYKLVELEGRHFFSIQFAQVSVFSFFPGMERRVSCQKNILFGFKVAWASAFAARDGMSEIDEIKFLVRGCKTVALTEVETN